MDMERWGEDDGIFMDIEMPMPVEEGEWESVEDVFQMKGNRGNRARYPKIMVMPMIPRITTPIEKPCGNCDGSGAGKSYIRFFQANDFIGPVDIYINGRLMAEELPFKRFTAYKRANDGFYRVAVYASGERRNPLHVQQVSIRSGQIYTMAVIGTNQDISLESIRDVQFDTNPMQSYVRFVQFSYNAPTMDFLIDGRLVLRYVDYQEISRYLTLMPGKHKLMLKESDTKRILLEDPLMMLRPGKVYAVYIVGNADNRKGLQTVLSMEGPSYLSF